MSTDELATGGDSNHPPPVRSGAAPPDERSRRPGGGASPRDQTASLIERIDVMQRLVQAVTHDINNQLTVVVGSAELLREHAPDEDSRDVVTTALTAARRAAVAVVELQEIVLAGEGDASDAACRTSAALEHAMRAVPRLLGREMTVESEIPGSLPEVALATRELENVIHVLAMRMREWTGGRGHVRLHARASPEEDGVVLRMTCGPALTARPPMPATVQAAAAGSGGRASVEPGAEGVVAELVLPEVSSGGKERDSAKRTVLLVEDEEGVRALMTQALAARGLRVLPARDGEEALSLLAAAPHDCDLVILDLGLPRLSAGETWRRIREVAPGVPVLLVSGDPDGALAAGLPADLPMVGKPFTLEVLARAVLGRLR